MASRRSGVDPGRRNRRSVGRAHAATRPFGAAHARAGLDAGAAVRGACRADRRARASSLAARHRSRARAFRRRLVRFRRRRRAAAGDDGGSHDQPHLLRRTDLSEHRAEHVRPAPRADVQRRLDRVRPPAVPAGRVQQAAVRLPLSALHRLPRVGNRRRHRPAPERPCGGAAGRRGLSRRRPAVSEYRGGVVRRARHGADAREPALGGHRRRRTVRRLLRHVRRADGRVLRPNADRFRVAVGRVGFGFRGPVPHRVRPRSRHCGAARPQRRAARVPPASDVPGGGARRASARPFGRAHGGGGRRLVGRLRPADVAVVRLAEPDGERAFLPGRRAFPRRLHPARRARRGHRAPQARRGRRGRSLSGFLRGLPVLLCRQLRLRRRRALLSHHLSRRRRSRRPRRDDGGCGLFVRVSPLAGAGPRRRLRRHSAGFLVAPALRARGGRRGVELADRRRFRAHRRGDSPPRRVRVLAEPEHVSRPGHQRGPDGHSRRPSGLCRRTSRTLSGRRLLPLGILVQRAGRRATRPLPTGDGDLRCGGGRRTSPLVPAFPAVPHHGRRRRPRGRARRPLPLDRSIPLD